MIDSFREIEVLVCVKQYYCLQLFDVRNYATMHPGWRAKPASRLNRPFTQNNNLAHFSCNSYILW